MGSEKTWVSRKDCASMLQCLAVVTEREVKKTGKITIPGVAMLKTRRKPATKAGKREMFGQVVVVKAQPAKTVVKAFPVAAIKKAFLPGMRSILASMARGSVVTYSVGDPRSGCD